MSHKNQLAIVKTVANSVLNFSPKISVIEIGSYNVNGEVRQFFNQAESYFGIDLTSGPGVDAVASGHEFGKTGFYDVAVACEVLEHNPFWVETVFNMIRITKPGGIVLITCASTGRIEHGTDRTNSNLSPGTSAVGWNYYSNVSVKNFIKTIKVDQHFEKYNIQYIPSSADLYFIGEKKTNRNKFEYFDFARMVG